MNTEALAARLNRAADAHNRPHASKDALRHWSDTLRDFTTEDVEAAFDRAAQIVARYPTPADIFKFADEHRARRAMHKRADDEGGTDLHTQSNPEIARVHIAKLFELLGHDRRAQAVAGTFVNACDAAAVAEREPGCDDV